MRVRKFLGRTCLVVSASLMLVAAVGPPTNAQENPDAGRPTFWESKAFARAVQFQFNTDPLLVPFQDLVRFDFAEGDANWSAFGEARGRASTVWPGDAAVKGPPVLCDQLAADGDDEDKEPDAPFQCPEGFPPVWPFSVTAEGETTDAQTDGAQQFEGGPFSGGGFDAKAHAARDHVETVAVYEGFSVEDEGGVSKAVADNVAPPLRDVAQQLDAEVRSATAPLGPAFQGIIGPFAENGVPVLLSPNFGLGGTIPSFEQALTFEVDDTLFSVESIKAVTRQEFVADNTVLVARGETVLAGVKLFGGLVTIDEVVTSAVSRTDGQAVSEVAHTSTVTGLTVAGIPAGLNENGVAIGADGILAGNERADLDIQVENVLGRTGLHLRLVGVDERLQQGNVQSGATGVLVSIAKDLRALPAGAVAFTSLTLGNVGTQAFVPPALDLGFGGENGGGFEGGGGGDDFSNVLSGGTTNTGGGFAFQPQGDEFVAAPPGSGPGGTQAGFGPFGDGPVRLIPTELLRGLAADRMSLLYLAWAVGAVGLVLLSRLYLPRQLTSAG